MDVEMGTTYGEPPPAHYAAFDMHQEAFKSDFGSGSLTTLLFVGLTLCT